MTSTDDSVVGTNRHDFGAGGTNWPKWTVPLQAAQLATQSTQVVGTAPNSALATSTSHYTINLVAVDTNPWAGSKYCHWNQSNNTLLSQYN
jgi:hypothetical protein